MLQIIAKGKNVMDDIRELFQTMTRRFGFLNKNCCSIIDMEISAIHSHILYEVERRNKPSMQEVADSLGTDITTFSRQVQKLIKIGLLVKQSHEKDRRVQLLSLTKKGKEVALTIDQQMRDRLQEIFSYMSEEEREKVVEGMKILNHSLVKSTFCCQTNHL